MSGFQTSVNIQQAPGVAGDFAGANPRICMVAGEHELVTGTGGVNIGRFAWAAYATGLVQNSWRTACRLGFVHRDQQGLITTWLTESGYNIPVGLPVTLHIKGDFLASFAGGATAGLNVYASYADGTAKSGASAPTNTFTANTTDTSATITVTAVNTGMVIAVGQPVSGTNIPAAAYISALGTGTGGAGTYTISAAATGTATGTTVTATTAVDTGFNVINTVSAGELAKITSWG